MRYLAWRKVEGDIQKGKGSQNFSDVLRNFSRTTPSLKLLVDFGVVCGVCFLWIFLWIFRDHFLENAQDKIRKIHQKIHDFQGTF